jgi:hypothetical protein
VSTDAKRLTVYSIKEREGKKSVFIRIGTAFVNKDDSLNVYLDALPIDGKLHIREDKEKPANKQEDSF